MFIEFEEKEEETTPNNANEVADFENLIQWKISVFLLGIKFCKMLEKYKKLFAKRVLF